MRDALDLKEFKPNRKVPNYAPPTQKFSQQWLPVQKKIDQLKPVIFIHVPLNNTKY